MLNKDVEASLRVVLAGSVPPPAPGSSSHSPGVASQPCSGAPASSVWRRSTRCLTSDTAYLLAHPRPLVSCSSAAAAAGLARGKPVTSLPQPVGLTISTLPRLRPPQSSCALSRSPFPGTGPAAASGPPIHGFWLRASAAAQAAAILTNEKRQHCPRPVADTNKENRERPLEKQQRRTGQSGSCGGVLSAVSLLCSLPVHVHRLCCTITHFSYSPVHTREKAAARWTLVRQGTFSHKGFFLPH